MNNTKIRSWNEELKQFFYFLNGRYYSDADCKNIISERVCSEFNWQNVEWFTILKDKNGNEIYEGDIFNCIYHSDGHTDVYEVVYHNNSTGFILKRHGKCSQTLVHISVLDVSRYEIIGNIHSNPSLLTTHP